MLLKQEPQRTPIASEAKQSLPFDLTPVSRMV